MQSVTGCILIWQFLSRYNNLVWAFLEEHDATPVIEDGDMDIMASAHPDFIGFNYYSTATVEWNDGTEPAGRGDQRIQWR